MGIHAKGKCPSVTANLWLFYRLAIIFFYSCKQMSLLRTEDAMPPTDLPSQTMKNSREPLYTVWAVVLATFLGSPLAGGVLLSMNCRRLSQPSLVRDIFLWTGLLTLGSLLLGGLVPQEQRLLEAMLVGVQVFIMYFLAARLQGRAIALHLQQGGEIASYWSAVGIGIVCGIVLLWVLVGLGLMPAPSTGIEGETPQTLL